MPGFIVLPNVSTDNTLFGVAELIQYPHCLEQKPERLFPSEWAYLFPFHILECMVTIMCFPFERVY
jgi:hypothetical protein